MTALPGRIGTFYSYKGGVGRTMALVNVASVLASNGLRVLTVDWDVEAPGLHRYFSDLLADPQLTASNGLLDVLVDFQEEAMTPGRAASDWYVGWLDLSKYVVDVSWTFRSGGRLSLMGAGRQGPHYAERLKQFDWDRFYERFGGAALLEALKRRMRDAYDYVLIDSRTGIAEAAEVAIVQMPDDLVLCFAANTRSIDGARRVAEAVSQQRAAAPQGPVRLFPVPSRVEFMERSRTVDVLEMARQSFDRFLSQEIDHDEYWNDISIPYVPYLSFNEAPAALNKQHERGGVMKAAERLAWYLTDGRVTHYIS